MKLLGHVRACSSFLCFDLFDEGYKLTKTHPTLHQYARKPNTQNALQNAPISAAGTFRQQCVHETNINNLVHTGSLSCKPMGSKKAVQRGLLYNFLSGNASVDRIPPTQHPPHPLLTLPYSTILGGFGNYSHCMPFYRPPPTRHIDQAHIAQAPQHPYCADTRPSLCPCSTPLLEDV